MRPVPATTTFLNLDLEIRSPHQLSGLVRALAPGAFALHEEPHFACLELSSWPTCVEPALMDFVGLIHALPEGARAAWDGCTQRRFDIGIQAGPEPASCVFKVPDVVVRQLASVGAELAFTVYAPEVTAR
ncbi:hypothetical protein A176_001222 [Myxococcus hansupus]|uniref:DUF4279 domain-containing protein n=1 Tax=Pseudomyxococcus hansupus TaxID=1297742 RepID=A0A0H4WSH0_9BACT|nr:hypothetical protein [Myxococcus hansupus]AKQ64310.1 hypothetical protein A176_001222 [Myxococcus hansupus]